MISRAAITAWSAKVPWELQEQVEQDLIISRALIAIFSDELLSRSLAFRGGTALHKLFFNESKRYSEDIDLVQVTSEPIGPVLTRLREVLSFLGEARSKRKMSNNVLLFKYDSTYEPVAHMKLKVEINCKEHFTVLERIQKPFAMENLWFSGNTQITTYQLDELIGTKTRALYQRRKGRDLFDLYCVLNENLVDVDEVIRCYRKYIQFPDNVIPSAKEYAMNLDAKMQLEDFRKDISLLKRPDYPYDIDKAYQLVQEKLIEQM
jgi:predicted nucleotidyltransferase component of viral defense system